MKDTNHNRRVGTVKIVKSAALDMLLNEHAHLFNSKSLRTCPLYQLEGWAQRIALEEGLAALLDHFANGGDPLKSFRFVVEPGPRRLRENEQHLAAAAQQIASTDMSA
jgi:hypothetical protein